MLEDEEDTGPESFGDCLWRGRSSYRDLRLSTPQKAWRSAGFISPGPGWVHVGSSFPIYCSDECQRKSERD